MLNADLPYSELTAKVIGCAMEVHNSLGSGFQEVLYQRALAIEMEKQEIDFIREFNMRVFYKGELIGSRRVDFFVEDILSVELKALGKLEPIHFTQAINYVEAYGLEVGLLINFGEESLKFHRVKNPKFFKKKPNRVKGAHPTHPTNPVQDNHPTNPNNPIKPVEDSHPTNPNNPINPVQDNHPTNPINPTNPV